MSLPHPDRNHQLLSLRFYSGYHPTASKISHIKVLLNKPLYDNEIGSWWRQAHTNAAERHDPSRFMNSTILEVDNGIKSARGSIRPVVKRERLKKNGKRKLAQSQQLFEFHLKRKKLKGTTPSSGPSWSTHGNLFITERFWHMKDWWN